MQTTFSIPALDNQTYTLETSVWSGKSKLLQNGKYLLPSKEKGMPYLITLSNGEIKKLFLKPKFPDFMPEAVVDNQVFPIFDKLPWYQYLLGALPFGLIFIGGIIGGAIGGGFTLVNFMLFRSEKNESMKYIKVLLFTSLAYALYFCIIFLIKTIFRQP